MKSMGSSDLRQSPSSNWFPLLVTACLSCLIGALLVRGGQRPELSAGSSSGVGEVGLDTSIANRQLTPDQVVSLQVEAIRKSLDDPRQMVICYSLASPGNRQVTGPYTDFCAMVADPPFRDMITSADWQLGQVHI